MRHVLITGASGFLGRRLTKTLIARRSLRWQREEAPIVRLTLIDRVAPLVRAGAGIAIDTLVGDLGDPSFLNRLLQQRFDTIFHLASGLTLEVERDPDGAYAANVDTLRRIIAGAEVPSTLVFTSSLAVYGGHPKTKVDEGHAVSPTTAYGTHKAIAELLIADASRRGKIDGRVLRLPIVLARAGPSNSTPTISDLVASIMREPLEGRDIVVPLAPKTIVPLTSAGTVAQALIALHDAPGAALPASRTINLPSLSVSVQDLAQHAQDRAPNGCAARIDYAPDERVQTIVESWPSLLASRFSQTLGIAHDPDIAALIDDYLLHRTEE
jgi:nucleoside-diphosphate-sugar epimerase